MNQITTTTVIKENGHTLAYLVPVEEYKNLKYLWDEEDKCLLHLAKKAINGGLANQEEQDYFNSELQRIWK